MTAELEHVPKRPKLDDPHGDGSQTTLPGENLDPGHPAASDRFRATNLYDRQIRLWGWDAQQRLMKSKLLMYGMNGTGAEVLKNLMLGGIKQITIIDSEIVTEADLTTNFFLRRQDVGQLNRATATAERAKLLNSTCILTPMEIKTSDVTVDLVKDYDLVVLNAVFLDEAVRIGNACRILGIPIFASQISGFHAFFVNDLNGLQFEIPPLKASKSERTSSLANFAANMPSTSNGRKDNKDLNIVESNLDSNSETRDLTITCPDLSVILDAKAVKRSGLASPVPKRMFGLKKIDPYLNLELLLIFAARKGRYPSYAHSDDDLKELKQILDKIRPEGDTRVVEPGEMLTADANFTCALLGGTLAQEVITVLTRRNHPVYNLYYLAASDACGSREYVE